MSCNCHLAPLTLSSVGIGLFSSPDPKFSASLLDKMYGIDLGWNTFSLSGNWVKPFGLPFNITATGYLGGLSGTLLFKPNKVTAGGSYGLGVKIDAGW